MKRPYRIFRVGVVALSICLLTVDPASACKLLGNRRCCCVCVPVAGDCGQDKSCTDVVPAKGEAGQVPEPQPLALPTPSPAPTTPHSDAPPPRSQPSPSDLPPATTTGGGTLIPSQQPKPNNDQANIAPTRNTSPAAPAAANHHLRLGEVQPPPPANLDRAPDNTGVIHEPALAPAGLAREPATIQADQAGQVENALAAPASTTRETPKTALSPSPLDVAPRSTREPAAAVTTAPLTNLHNAATAEPAPQTTIKRATDETLSTAVPPMPPGGRLPASSVPAVPRTAVDAPGFPPASDDPFAPLPPKKPQPIEDDPFAPLPPATRPAAPAAPIAAEPTNAKAADALTLDPEGRLPLRDWSDNTGAFRIKAKLVLILDGKVRLQKETGRTTTVPLDRLSEQDRSYVNEVISRYGKDLTTLDQLAAR